MSKEELLRRWLAARKDAAFQAFMRRAMMPPADRLGHTQ
jgi:hypothetical protein